MKNTNEFFIKGKLSVAMDGGAGSSGKGKIGAFLVANADNCDFVCNTFMPNASHTIVEGDDENRQVYVYKSLSSCAHHHNKYKKMYIGQGSVIHLPSLLKELEESGMPKNKLGISPIAMVVQDIDAYYEMGQMDLEGNEYEQGSEGTIKTGTTASGSGAARARKILRKGNTLLARDVPELKQFICNVSREIIQRLENGQAGLLEIAQGFQLSYGLPEFYPYTTSRNCTVAAGFDDMMVPPAYLGNVLLNFRTFPIRIHSYKYIAIDPDPIERLELTNKSEEAIEKNKIALKEKHGESCRIEMEVPANSEGNPSLVVYPESRKAGEHLFWEEVQRNVPHERIESYSGDFYDDQIEIDWQQVTQLSGSPTPLMECTTLTKLPRRVATFSKKNLIDSIMYNQTPHKVFISVNFVNYLDWSVYKRNDVMTEKIQAWLQENIAIPLSQSGYDNVVMRYLGTSEYTQDTLTIE